ncbi:MAG: hypothetical protein GEV06_18115 [Luteitalea sp.]|nr:hypothetical protein [Luteitalea sp.]
MLLASSFQRRIVVAAGAVLGFCLLYEGTILDSRYAPRQVEVPELSAPPAMGARLRFSATAYCKGRTTASGATVRRGIAAADPALLPVGSVIQVDAAIPRYNGVYTIMDTGPKVQGRAVDLYMWSCHEALRFGRRPIKLTVLRLGWSPGTSGPERAKELFHRRERKVMVDHGGRES